MKFLIAAVITAAMCVFIATAPPTIYLGDSGEIVSAACTLGIGHPPGYPLYTLCGKIACFLPLGDQAFRINLLAALFGALTLLLLYLSISYLAGKITGDSGVFTNKIPALALSVIFIFSGVFWFEATQAKGGIYCMECFTVLAAFYALIKYVYEKQKRWFYLTAWLAGLLPAVHPTAWLAVFFIMAALLREGGIRDKKAGAAAFFFLTALILPDAFLFIRAGSAGMRWADMSTPAEVIRHITRAVYSSDDSPPLSFFSVFFKLKTYALALVSGFNIAVVFAAAGIYWLYRNCKNALFALGAFFLLNLGGIIFFTNNSATELYVYTNSGFYLVNDLVIMAFASFGIWAAASLIRQKQAAAALTLLLLVFALALPMFKYQNNDQSRVYLAYDLAQNIFKTAAPGDAVFARSDLTVFGMQYIKYIKKQFSGISAYDEMGNMLDLSWLKGIRQEGRFSKIAQDDLIFDMQKKMPGRLDFFEITSYPDKGLVPSPFGLLYRLVDEGHYMKNSGSLMQLYSLRDCFNNKRPDFINRNVIARYYIKSAEFAAIARNPAKFNLYRAAAERAGFDIPNVLRGIAYIFFTDLNDVNNTMLYLEKSMENDPYDFPTLNLIIDIYSRLSMWDKALKWYKIYYDREWDYARREKILGQMKFIKEKYGVK